MSDMKFKFTIQPYQTEAVESVTRVFAGQGFASPLSYRRDVPQAAQTSLFGGEAGDDFTMAFANALVELDAGQMLKCRPILILDEPQKMGGNATQASLKEFCPLFCLNYSATHRERHALVYVLDALDAYRRKLVKQIEVKGFAIAFDKGTVKHIFFIAETKGTMESLPLKPIEQAKIKCAKKLFARLSDDDVVYHEVKSYQSLLDIMEKL